MNIYVNPIEIWMPEKRKQRFHEYVEKILDSRVLSGGEFTEKMEKELARRAGKKYAVSTNQANTAFLLAAGYYYVVQKKKVGVFPALAFPCMYNQLKVVGCDLEIVDDVADAFFMDASSVKRKDEKVAFPVAYYGVFLNDYDKELVDEFGGVVYDAAQSYGVMKTKADYVVSFHGLKPIAGGEGGALLTDNEELYEFAKYGSCVGFVGRRSHVFRAFDCTMAEVVAALILSGLDFYDEMMADYRKASEIYRKELDDMYVNRLAEKGIRFEYSGFLCPYVVGEGKRLLYEGALRNWYGVSTLGVSTLYMPYEPVWREERKLYRNAFVHAENHVLLPCGALNEKKTTYVARAVKAARKRIEEGDYSLDYELWRWTRDESV